MLLILLILLTLLLGLGGLYLAEKIALPTATPDEAVNRYAALKPQFAAEDVKNIRFSAALRGYRMAEVDETIGQLEERIRQQEIELAKLKSSNVDPQQVL